MADNLDPKLFPNAGDPNCSHTIGCYKSGRCRSCGYRVWAGTTSMTKRRFGSMTKWRRLFGRTKSSK